jgi:hypothetical protein
VSEFKRLLPQILRALVIGLVGGLLFDAIDFPLAWMLGPMTTTLIAALARQRVAVPMNIRAITLAIIGVYLGTAFQPDLLDHAALWPVSLTAVLLYVPVVTLLVMVYYRQVARFDRITSVFCSAPGGLTTMTILGTAAGGNEQQISMVHSLRIMLLVFSIPLIIAAVTGVTPVRGPAAGAVSVTWLEGLMLLVAAVAGPLVARRLRMPSPWMTGAMFATAALYMTETVQGVPPRWLLNVALLVLGTSIGSRFTRVTPRELGRIAIHAVTAVALIIFFSASAAWGVALLTGLDFLALMLAFAPGGVAEMSLIAVALDVDPGFVSLHHLARIFEIILLAPLVARWLSSRSTETS